LWFLAAERLHLDWLAQRIEQLTAEGALQAMARTGLRENARVLQSKIVAKVLKAHGKSKDPLACWENWAQREAESLRQWERTIGEVIAEDSADFASLSVCVEALRALAD
jgi:NAD-specific glutamate dehydrogenase